MGDVRNLLEEAGGRVVSEDVFLVYIFPPPPIIDQSNYVIEH